MGHFGIQNIQPQDIFHPAQFYCDKIGQELDMFVNWISKYFEIISIYPPSNTTLEGYKYKWKLKIVPAVVLKDYWNSGKNWNKFALE